MAGLSIRVYKYDARTKEMREVSAWSGEFEKLPNLPLLDDRWPLCECHRCRPGRGRPAHR
ncbi:hypothetical protein GCM10010145_11850 [Streptomyces ruber]|uniref:Uncharacterized protein n=2 Tax=Streptomyces TaxID=1883 RepID=A0A918B9B0_9ACTN|nr:hypothetical protein [Streptomyces ruber]GGQ44811.1 hypothetical protein GCM10010145_11850 [Streptomyces ruber]